MNIKAKIIIVLVILIHLALSVKSQGPYWKLNGNPVGGSDGVNGTNNSIGTNGGFSLNFKTNNTQRLTILDGGTASTNGYIGIGNAFTTPQNRLHLHQVGSIGLYTQWTNGTTNNNNGNQGFKIGISDNGDAEIRQQEAGKYIGFYTGTIKRMHINGAGASAGYIGIGPNFTDPQSMFHIHFRILQSSSLIKLLLA